MERILRVLWLGLISIAFFVATVGLFVDMAGADDYEIVIIGSVDSSIEHFKKADFWGKEDRANQLTVPRILTVMINDSWKHEADQVTVDVKKELFYRALVPLILYANELILRDRDKLISLTDRHKSGESLSGEDLLWLRNQAAAYRLIDGKGDTGTPSDAEVLSVIDELLVRVDIIPFLGEVCDSVGANSAL